MFALLLAAGLDGINSKLELDEESDASAMVLPASLNQAIIAARDSQARARRVGRSVIR